MERVPLMRSTILVFSVLGLLFFFSAFVASFVSPVFVERSAKDLIRYQVEKKVHEKIASFDDNMLVEKARMLFKKHEMEIDSIRKQLEQKLPERVAETIAKMRNLDCECRQETERWIRDGYERRLNFLTQAQQQLTEFIQIKYMQVRTQLIREFRIFTGTHAFVFLFLVVAVLAKPRAGLQLLPPALLLLLASLVNAYLYLFNQNWLSTIVFSSYVGFAYVVYMGIVFAFLCDIVFNKCRVTSWLLCRLCEMIGSAGSSISPC